MKADSHNFSKTASSLGTPTLSERVRSALSHLSSEKRDVWVRQAMAIKSEFEDDGFEMWDHWSSLSSAYRAIDARDVWKSVKAGKGITIASLLYDAKQAGWKDDTAYKKPSAAEIEQRRKQRAERDALAAAQELADQEAAALKAQALWAAAAPCESHAYLERKGVKSHGLRYGRFEIEKIDPNTGEVTVIGLQALLMPIMDRSRKIWTLQAFSAKPDGRKSLLKNGRKSGNFFVIGSKPLAVDGRPVFILVEGYATGASVHEATGHMVMVCVDAGNIRAVARTIRARSPDALIVIAADNDTGTEGNPGLTEANKAAKESGCLVVYPPNGGDFNDLHVALDIEAVADVICRVLESPTPHTEGFSPVAQLPGDALRPVTDVLKVPREHQMDTLAGESDDHFLVLGFHGEQYIFYHKAKRQVISRTRKDFTEVGLAELAPINWWETSFPSKNGVDKTRAAEWIFEVANRRGPFDPQDRLRGRGAWMDNNRIVFHHGDRLTVEGVNMDLYATLGRYIYEASDPLPDLCVPATNDDGLHLIKVAQMASWKNPSSVMLLAGWVFLAPICGVLNWRPHIWVSGPAGSGKSSILERYVGSLLGRFKVQVDGGDSSAAGIRQTLRCDARPVILDEAESNTDQGRNRIREILTLARGASSAGDASVVKGTVGGKAMEFRVRSMFCFGSIGTVLVGRASDASRFSLLELISPRRNEKNCDNWPQMNRMLIAIAADKSWPARLLARALQMAPVVQECINIFSAAVADKLDGNRRHGDQYGTLLAGYWCLYNTEALNPEMAREIVDRIHFDDYVERSAAPDASRCLDQLLDATIIEKGSSVAVRTLVGLAAGYWSSGVDISADRAKQMLQERGMTVTKLGNKGQFFAVIRDGSSIGTLLRGTPFESDWQSHLPRVEGYEALPATSFGRGSKNRAHGFPLNQIVSAPNDEPPI